VRHSELPLFWKIVSVVLYFALMTAFYLWWKVKVHWFIYDVLPKEWSVGLGAVVMVFSIGWFAWHLLILPLRTARENRRRRRTDG
jgi:hypothetical protein